MEWISFKDQKPKNNQPIYVKIPCIYDENGFLLNHKGFGCIMLDYEYGYWAPDIEREAQQALDELVQENQEMGFYD